MSKVAFVVGNGVSRKEVNLESLVDKAPIYGCNALCRDFSAWNYLVAIDDGMIDEIKRYHMNKGHVIFPDEDERWEPAEYSPKRRRANAGMIAMQEAIKRGGEIIYCLGMDFVLKSDIAVSNVYRDSENYGPETRSTQDDNYYRIKYLSWFAKQNPKVKFVFVVPDNISMRDIGESNVVGMKMETFKKKLNS